METLRRLLWSLVCRENDPQRLDWASLACLLVYLGLTVVLISLFNGIMISIAWNGMK